MNNLPSGAHDAFGALRIRNYRLFVAGWLPASTGLQMQATALGWEIYDRTHDPLALGWIGVARALPTMALALPAGQIVDLLDRRKVLLGTQLGFTIVNLALAFGSNRWEVGTLSGGFGLLMMYVLIAMTGMVRVFNGPARASLLPALLPGGATGPLFHNAVTWNSGVFQLAATVGPLAAGLLIYLTHAAWPVYVVSAAGCLWFAMMCVMMHDGIEYGRDGATPVASVWAAIRPRVLLPGIFEGARHLWNEKVVFGAILLDLMAVLLGGATALMPVYASDILHVGPIGLGALKAAPYVGALLMALVLAFRAPFERAGATLLWAVIAFGVGTIIFGVSTNLWLSLLMLLALGAADNISVVIRHVLVSARTPDRLRGRVAAVNSVFIESSNELGGFESGLVAKLFGPVISVVSGGIGTILVVLGVAWKLPELRKLTRLHNVPSTTNVEVAKEAAAEAPV